MGSPDPSSGSAAFQTSGMYSIKEPSDYMGGFVATGTMAIVQTITPLLVGQLWKRDDLKHAGYNPWFAYAWKAMQATGVISYGLQAFGFLLALMFDLSFLEKLGYICLWITHGGIFGLLSFTTVIAYFVSAIVKYNESIYEGKREMWITLTAYTAVQIVAGYVGITHFKNTVMYLVAKELKDMCEMYGAFCGEVGIMQPKVGATEDDYDSDLLGGDSAASSLVAWEWDF